MENLSDFLSSLVTRMKGGESLKPSDRDELRKWQERCEQARRDGEDKWEAMKAEISKIEFKILKKKKERDASHGKVREMVEEEIDLLFNNLDRKDPQIRLLRRKAEALEITIDKINEVEHASNKDVTESELDILAIKLEEALDEVKNADAALSQLRGVSYEGRSRDRSDNSERLADLEAAPEERPPARNYKNADRLRRLEQDMEGTAE